jgi:hypothetical protein
MQLPEVLCQKEPLDGLQRQTLFFFQSFLLRAFEDALWGTAVLVDELDAGGFRRGFEPLASGCLLLAHFDQRLCGNAQPLMQSPDHFERERAPSI